MQKMRVGITGQTGFIGSHLFNTFGLYPNKFERIPFEKDIFNDSQRLESFVKQCDVIIHLAAVNRHDEPQKLYDINIKLVEQIIGACENSGATPHILHSSSIQEDRGNLYGKSKRDGRVLFENWAQKNKSVFTGLMIPNVFGPFGRPKYNSVVATFCHQLTHNEHPRVVVDSELSLIYVGELVQAIINIIDSKHFHNLNETNAVSCYQIPSSTNISVSSLLKKLLNIKLEYFDNGIVPCLDNPFDKHLFNTFLCYIDHKLYFPYNLKLSTDNRGTFVEIIKLNCGGQVSFSTTVPGITRGNHYHTRKAERFAVIKGRAKIDIRRIGTSKILSFELNGNQASFVDMPIWHTHSITNIGDEDLYTVFWINEHFDPDDADTFFENV